ncbi:hypothetical protein HDU93_008808 [Gonapodya sp. JEL0774]|nr:hypothetical protein HDU93_008808 [Gonapodya sp. JEL0774]
MMVHPRWPARVGIHLQSTRRWNSRFFLCVVAAVVLVGLTTQAQADGDSTDPTADANLCHSDSPPYSSFPSPGASIHDSHRMEHQSLSSKDLILPANDDPDGECIELALSADADTDILTHLDTAKVPFEGSGGNENENYGADRDNRGDSGDRADRGDQAIFPSTSLAVPDHITSEAPTLSPSPTPQQDPTNRPHPPIIHPLPPSHSPPYTGKERFNFASYTCAAAVLSSTSTSTGSSAILNENRDAYMLNRCGDGARDPRSVGKAGGKPPLFYVVVELCEDMFLDTLVLANLEFFSSTFRDVRVYHAKRYPPPNNRWDFVAHLRARNARDVQVFRVPGVKTWTRYVRLEVTSRHGFESLCPLTLLRVHGRPMTDDFAEEDGEGAGSAGGPQGVLVLGGQGVQGGRRGSGGDEDDGRSSNSGSASLGSHVEPPSTGLNLMDSIVTPPWPDLEREMDMDFGVVPAMGDGGSGDVGESSAQAGGGKPRPWLSSPYPPRAPRPAAAIGSAAWDSDSPPQLSTDSNGHNPLPDLRRLFDARFKPKTRPSPQGSSSGPSPSTSEDHLEASPISPSPSPSPPSDPPSSPSPDPIHTSSGSGQLQQQGGGQEGYFRSMLKRIAALERNTTMLVGFLEDQTHAMTRWMGETIRQMEDVRDVMDAGWAGVSDRQQSRDAVVDARTTVLSDRLDRLEYLLYVVIAVLTAILTRGVLIDSPSSAPWFSRSSGNVASGARLGGVGDSHLTTSENVVGTAVPTRARETGILDARGGSGNRQHLHLLSSAALTGQEDPLHSPTQPGRKRRRRATSPKQMARFSPVRNVRLASFRTGVFHETIVEEGERGDVEVESVESGVIAMEGEQRDVTPDAGKPERERERVVGDVQDLNTGLRNAERRDEWTVPTISRDEHHEYTGVVGAGVPDTADPELMNVETFDFADSAWTDDLPLTTEQ